MGQLKFMVSLKLVSYVLLFLFASCSLCFANTTDHARKILQKYNNQVKGDMSYPERGFFSPKIKQEFLDYYKADIVPRLETPVKYIRDEAIQWLDADRDGDEDIIFWTEGVWPGYMGIAEREFLYVVEMQDGQPVHLTSKGMTSINQDGFGKYKNSMFFKYPNAHCGYNDFVIGMLNVSYFGGSGSTFTRYLITYNRYEQRIEIDEESSAIFLVPKVCVDY